MQRSPVHAACAVRELEPARDLLGAFSALRGDPCPWLLDSALPSARLGRYSFAGADPYLVLRAFGDRIEIDCRRAVHPGLALGRRTLRGDPLAVARDLMPPAPAGAIDLPFVTGAVGVLGYELAQQIDAPALHGLEYPELGMEAIWKIEIEEFPAFIVVDDKGNDFYAQLLQTRPATLIK